MGPHKTSCAWPRRPRAQPEWPRHRPGAGLVLARRQTCTLRPASRHAAQGLLNTREGRLHLTPREQEKLLVFVAAELARKRQKRGLKLNYPEAVAIISAEILEAARDGKSVSDIMVLGTRI